MKDKYLLISSALFIVYWLFTLFGLVEFNLWNQVLSIKYPNPDAKIPSYIFGIHQHAPRYALVSPLFWLHDQIGVSYDWLFSILVPVLLALSVYILTITMIKINYKSINYWHSLLFSVVTIGISFFMNGRAILAILGSAILVGILVDFLKSNSCKNLFIKQFFGFWLVSVTSGAYIISFVFFYSVFLYFLMQGKVRFLYLREKIVQTAIFSILVLFFHGYLQINLEFFGGGFNGVAAMLHHGFGYILVNFSLFNLFAVLFGLVVILATVYRYFREQWMLLFILSVCILGGAFGWTAMIVSLPAFLLLSAILANKLLAKICYE